MAEKKKILCFMPSMPDGSQRMMLTLLKLLDPEKYEVLIVIVHQKMLGIENFIPKHFRMIHVKIRNIWDFTVTRMVKIIKKEKADFLFSSIFYMNLRVVIAGKITGTPVVLRNDNFVSVMSNRQNRITKIIYKWAKVVIMQQEQMRDEFKSMFNFPDDKMVVIHNPIDYETIDRLSKEASPYNHDDCIRYVNVARFDWKKGQDVLAQAFVKIVKDNPMAHLYYIGRINEDSPTYKKTIEIVNSNHLNDNVHFMGQQMNPYVWMKYADCFVLSSRQEGLPNVLLEAMYLGKPVVSTNCIDMIYKLVKDGYNGYVVNVEDTDGMCDAMKKAIRLKDFEMIYKSEDVDKLTNIFK